MEETARSIGWSASAAHPPVGALRSRGDCNPHQPLDPGRPLGRGDLHALLRAGPGHRPRHLGHGLRKIAHTAEYALLGALLYRAVRNAPAALLLASAYAVTDEIHQTFVSGRHGSPVDWLIDTAGAAVGVAIAVRVWR